MFSKTNLFLCLSLAILLIVISSQADAREMSKGPATVTQAMNSNTITDQKMGAGIIGKIRPPKPGSASKLCSICPCKFLKKTCSNCPKCHD